MSHLGKNAVEMQKFVGWEIVHVLSLYIVYYCINIAGHQYCMSCSCTLFIITLILQAINIACLVPCTLFIITLILHAINIACLVPCTLFITVDSAYLQVLIVKENIANKRSAR